MHVFMSQWMRWFGYESVYLVRHISTRFSTSLLDFPGLCCVRYELIQNATNEFGKLEICPFWFDMNVMIEVCFHWVDVCDRDLCYFWFSVRGASPLLCFYTENSWRLKWNWLLPCFGNWTNNFHRQWPDKDFHSIKFSWRLYLLEYYYMACEIRAYGGNLPSRQIW